MARRVVILLLFLLAARPSTVLAETVDDVVRGLEGAYGKMQDLRGEFAQTAFNKSLNQSIPAKGAVYMKRPGKLRWEYSEPTAQEIISDGKTLWIYTPTLNPVNVGAAPEALASPAGTFLAVPTSISWKPNYIGSGASSC